jgi:hypothetical protein
MSNRTETLDLGADTLRELADLREAGECARVQRRMAEAVDARLAEVQTRLFDGYARQAGAGGLTGPNGTEIFLDSFDPTVLAARLQAASTILAAPPRTGPCTDDCPCATAGSAEGTVYHFPPPPGATGAGATAGAGAGEQDVACAMTEDEFDGDLTGRLAEWHDLLSQVARREAIDGGIALAFAHDADRTARLARMAAAEYRCCSFGSWTLVIDERGVRLEVRMPAEAHDMLFGMFGMPDPA